MIKRSLISSDLGDCHPMAKANRCRGHRPQKAIYQNTPLSVEFCVICGSIFEGFCQRNDILNMILPKFEDKLIVSCEYNGILLLYVKYRIVPMFVQKRAHCFTIQSFACMKSSDEILFLKWIKVESLYLQIGKV